MADTETTAATTATTSKGPGYCLIVRHAFLDYQVGDKITDSATIKELLAGDMAVYVIKSALAD